MEAFLAVLDKLVTLFVYIFIGYIIRKKDVVDEKFQAGLVKLLMWVCIPCLTINTLQTDYTPEMLSNGLSLFVISLIIYITSYILGIITAKIFRIKRDPKGIWIFMIMFSNNLFMGFPVIEAVLGSDALLYAAFLNIPVQIVMFTFGVQLIIKYGWKEGAKASAAKRLSSPLNIAMVIGLVLFVAGIKLPSSIRSATAGISGTITPLAMMYIGMVMSKSKMSEAFKDWKVYAVSFIRLILVPLAIYLIGKNLIADSIVFAVLVLSFGMPCSGNCATFAGEHGGDVDFAGRLTFVSTLLCLITIPFIGLLFI